MLIDLIQSFANIFFAYYVNLYQSKTPAELEIIPANRKNANDYHLENLSDSTVSALKL